MFMLLMETGHPEITKIGRTSRVLRDDAIVKRDSQLAETNARFCRSRAENHCHITNRIRWVSASVHAHDRAVVAETIIAEANFGGDRSESARWRRDAECIPNIASDPVRRL
jgi:hypothetical protein